MGMAEKATFLKAFEHELSDHVTATTLANVLSIASNILGGYDVVRVEAENPDKDDLLHAYVSAMQIQGRSEKTINRYVYTIKRMMEKVNVSTRQITVYHLRRYLAEEKDRGICDSTLEGTRQIFSAYFNWLQREGLLLQNPTANLGTIKCQKKVKRIYSDIDVERLKYECANVRDRAIICFLLSTGCRISEMTQLNRDSINFATLECTVLGKGNKERTVFLDAVSGMLIKEYLNTRKDECPALFAGKGSERLTPGGVRFMLRKLSEATGIENVHPHKFRRTLATNLIRHGMPIQEVASVLGHDKLDTTMQYVVLDKTDVRNSYFKYA